MALPPFPGNLLPQVGAVNAGKNLASNLSGNQSALPTAPVHPTSLPTINDELSMNLQEVILDGTSFPVEGMSDDEGRRTVAHQFYGVDAANIEDTGRKPSKFSFRGIFCNTISPTTKESWKQGQLFPQAYNNVLQSLENTGGPLIFQHPYKRGFIFVNVLDYKTSWRNDWRGGAVIDISVMETIHANNNDLANAPITSWNDPITLANQVSTTLLNFPQAGNNALGQTLTGITAALLTAVLDIINTPTYFSDTASLLVSLINSPATLAGSFVNNLQTAVYNSKQVIQVITSANDPAYAQLKSQLINLQNTWQQQLQQASVQQPSGGRLAQPINPILLYVVNAPTTLGRLTTYLNNSMDQILSLNPQFAASPIIGVNQAVRYYQQ